LNGQYFVKYRFVLLNANKVD